MRQICFSIKLAFPSDFSSQIARPASPPPRSPSALSPRHPFCSLLCRAPLQFCDQQGSRPSLPAWEPHVGDGLQRDWFDGGPTASVRPLRLKPRIFVRAARPGDLSPLLLGFKLRLLQAVHNPEGKADGQRSQARSRIKRREQARENRASKTLLNPRIKASLKPTLLQDF